MRRTVFAIALCTALAAGCAGSGRSILKGIDQYERANYRAALHEWDELNGSEGSMTDRSLVRYLAYRGLTHYHLGQRSYAIVFLGRARDAYARGNPAWLKPETVKEMKLALTELEKPSSAPAPAESAAAPAPAASASAAPAASAAPSASSPPASTGEALAPKNTTPGAKPATAAPKGSASPAKTTAPAAPPAPPAKTTAPPTKTAPASQSTSPR